MGIFEVKTHLSKLLEQVEKGETVTITKRGEAIAQIIPIEAARRKKKTADDIIQDFKTLRKRVKEDFPKRDTKLTRDMIDEGRR
jgi:prevent-host-death family protein